MLAVTRHTFFLKHPFLPTPNRSGSERRACLAFLLLLLPFFFFFTPLFFSVMANYYTDVKKNKRKRNTIHQIPFYDGRRGGGCDGVVDRILRRERERERERERKEGNPPLHLP